jgi:hypothetical protein
VRDVPSGGQYTWSNNQQNPTFEKLDRFLMNNSWEELFPLFTVHKLVREISDHSPFILDTMEHKEIKGRDFKFEKRWLKEEFLIRVTKVWKQPIRATNSLDKIQKKLKNVRNGLKGLGANLRGQDAKRKKKIVGELEELEKIEEESKLSEVQIRRTSQIQRELLHILDNEESFRQQRSRKNGCCRVIATLPSSTESLMVVIEKRTIFSLKNGDEVIQGDTDLLKHATNFYKNLFGPASDVGVRLDADIWSDADQMEQDKGVGPDGIPTEFYQISWEVIKKDMVDAFNDFHDHKIDLERINYGIINLTPKSDEADIIPKFRPICLLQVLFKIFTKTLTIRAIPVLDKIIQPCQITFIKGRYITDGVMLLQEVLRE